MHYRIVRQRDAKTLLPGKTGLCQFIWRPLVHFALNILLADEEIQTLFCRIRIYPEVVWTLVGGDVSFENAMRSFVTEERLPAFRFQDVINRRGRLFLLFASFVRHELLPIEMKSTDRVIALLRTSHPESSRNRRQNVVMDKPHDVPPILSCQQTGV